VASGSKEQRQAKALEALVNSVSLDEASGKSGVPRRTLNRWLAEDHEFIKQFRDLRRQVVEASVAKLQDASSEAVDTLRKNLTKGTPNTQVRAAEIILSYSIKAIELYDLESRLRALEEVEADG
jgi:hypothetical protein